MSCRSFGQRFPNDAKRIFIPSKPCPPCDQVRGPPARLKGTPPPQVASRLGDPAPVLPTADLELGGSLPRGEGNGPSRSGASKTVVGNGCRLARMVSPKLKQCFRIGFFFFKSSPLLPPRRPRLPAETRRPSPAPPGARETGPRRSPRSRAMAAGGQAAALGSSAALPWSRPLRPTLSAPGGASEATPLPFPLLRRACPSAPLWAPRRPSWRHTRWEPMVPKTSRGDRPPYRKTFLASGFFPPSHYF